jgi:hypothetical protein
MSFRFAFLSVLAVFLVFSAAAIQGCLSRAGCANGTCSCGQGDRCQFTCEAPPCHVTCDGDNPTCTAACANGTCTCGNGSQCNFTCDAPPCHVTCEATSSCTGVCADGQCTCGAGSTCDFTCMSSPCHTSCAAGASCLVHCPAGLAGTSSCDIVDCAAGTPIICPDGTETTCGAACP